MTRKRKPARKPFEEMSAAERIREAQQAIERTRYTMNQGDNRFGYYGQQCRESIARWEAVIARETARLGVEG
jgi:hypothetical protein